MGDAFLEKGDPRLPDLGWDGDFVAWRARLHEYIRLRGFRVWSDPKELEPIVDSVVAAHPREVAAYRAGKKKLLGFFFSKVMAATRDGAAPEVAMPLLESALVSETSPGAGEESAR